VPEKRNPQEPDQAEIERTVAVPTANGPGLVDAESLMKPVIKKNTLACCRGDEGYYARRREMLQSFKFVADRSEKDAVGAARRGGGMRHVLSFCSWLRAPAVAMTCCTG
jgi:hypothetical protein